MKEVARVMGLAVSALFPIFFTDNNSKDIKNLSQIMK
jgi:hypothetical protein